jgi:glycosyltransferase involved in cell wall biosynthesis
VTISDSSVADLRAVGVRAPIHVIPMASSTPALGSLPPKTPSGRLAIVGRLVPSKRVDHAIRALAALRTGLPAATLAVVGTGPELGALQRLAVELGVSDAVNFLGRVPEERKQQLLQDVDVLVACAVREGWGLTVTEAARVGTPSVCYRIPGLRDSVVDGRTGVLTEEEPSALAAAIRTLLETPAEYEAMRRRAWQHNADLSWARTAAAFASVLSPDATC